jgi:chemotaxis response regulator CheB
MPKAVADAGAADDILPIDKIGPRIREALRI